MAVDGSQRGSIDNAFVIPFGRQEIVLHSKKFPVQGHRRPDIHQGTQKPPLGAFICGKRRRLLLIMGHFRKQHLVEKLKSLHIHHDYPSMILVRFSLRGLADG